MHYAVIYVEGDVVSYINCDGEFYIISLMTDLVEAQTNKNSEDRKDMYELRDAINDDATVYNTRSLKQLCWRLFSEYCTDVFNFDKAYLILLKVIKPCVRRNGGTLDEQFVINRILDRDSWAKYTDKEKQLCQEIINEMFTKYVLVMRG